MAMAMAMAYQTSQIACCILLILTSILLITHIGASDANRKAYIVYMGDKLEDDTSSASDLHTSMLHEAIGSAAPKHLIHSYKKSFNAFLANLTEEEMRLLAKMEGVVSVFPSEKHKLHTSRSWDFMGFPLRVQRSIVESDIIIGVIDTGIWPESESFSDKGFGSPPKKWKGICQSSSNFTCNNKIIGARYYKSDGNFHPKDFISPRDTNGHGTHTASTAAGNIVNGASFDGLGLGIARGGVPSARIAVYKACWFDGQCTDHDILQAFDDAIADGVDIISISVGGAFARDYFYDSYSIGSFHAMKKGILTSQSAGNEGPKPQTVTSVSPWSLAMSASTIDRKFFAMVQLGNRKSYTGISVNTFQPKNFYPLIHAADAPNKRAGVNGNISRYCITDSLDKNLVKGKIVLCEAPTQGDVEVLAGAVGSVMPNAGEDDYPTAYPLPATAVGSDELIMVSNYIRSTRNPTAIILKSTEGKDPLAPKVAPFSSRGPNPITKNILKPDLIGPGVNILAAWPPFQPPSELVGDNRVVSYNIISGTSMSCPHASGVAAYVKSFHPTWSPAAIKSALMTTAKPMSAEKTTDAEFAYGSGFMNPIKAVDPGLVYDANHQDYLKFLCLQGYTAKKIKLIAGKITSDCSKLIKKDPIKDVNYPSIALSTLRNEPIEDVIYRVVTNVGSPASTYKAFLTPPSGYGIEVRVIPTVLKFKSVGEKKVFAVIINGSINTFENPIVSAALVWDDGVRKVRSPIVVFAPS